MNKNTTETQPPGSGVPIKGKRLLGIGKGMIEFKLGWDAPMTDEELNEIENNPVMDSNFGDNR